MRIFLSGKVDNEHGAWRDEVLTLRDGKRAWELECDLPYGPTVEIPINGNGLKVGPSRVVPNSYHTDPFVMPWPVLGKAVLGQHDYTGPFRQPLGHGADTDISDLGVAHGITSVGAHGQMTPEDQSVILRRCLHSIASSDLLFAYINTEDCFGTLCEIGYARAKGVFTVVCVDPRLDQWELWFPAEMAAHISYLGEGSIRLALLDAISARAAHKPDSTIQSAVTEARHSFGQIHRWSSDPRVRAEAERMLRRLEEGATQ